MKKKSEGWKRHWNHDARTENKKNMFFASTSEQTRERKTKFNFKEFIQTEANERQTDGKQAWKKGLTMKKKACNTKIWDGICSNLFSLFFIVQIWSFHSPLGVHNSIIQPIWMCCFDSANCTLDIWRHHTSLGIIHCRYLLWGQIDWCVKVRIVGPAIAEHVSTIPQGSLRRKQKKSSSKDPRKSLWKISLCGKCCWLSLSYLSLVYLCAFCQSFLVFPLVGKYRVCLKLFLVPQSTQTFNGRKNKTLQTSLLLLLSSGGLWPAYTSCSILCCGFVRHYLFPSSSSSDTFEQNFRSWPEFIPPGNP